MSTISKDMQRADKGQQNIALLTELACSEPMDYFATLSNPQDEEGYYASSNGIILRVVAKPYVRRDGKKLEAEEVHCYDTFGSYIDGFARGAGEIASMFALQSPHFVSGKDKKGNEIIFYKLSERPPFIPEEKAKTVRPPRMWEALGIDKPAMDAVN